MNSLRYISFLSLAMLLLSCGRTKLKPQEYVRYVENPDNKLKKVVQVSGWIYTFQYQPHDYILCKERVTEPGKVKQRLQQLKGTVWLNISFKNEQFGNSALKYNMSSAEQYQLRLNYYLTMASADISVQYDHSEPLKQIGYLFENNYGIAPQETMVVGYELPAGDSLPQKDLTVSYRDRVFENGIVKAVFTENTFKNLPILSANL